MAIYHFRKFSYRKMLFLGLSLVVVFLAYFYTFLYIDRERIENSRIYLDVYTSYDIVQDGKVVLSFDMDTLHSEGWLVDKYALLPSCKGLVATVVPSSVWINKYHGQDPQAILSVQSDSISALCKDSYGKVSELSYYLRSHNVTDEGYNMVSEYNKREKIIHDSTKKMVDSIGHIKKGKKLKIVYRQKFVARIPRRADGVAPKAQKDSIGMETCQVVKRNGADGICVLQLRSCQKPETKSSLPMYEAQRLLRLHFARVAKFPTLFVHSDSTGYYIGATDSLGLPSGEGYWVGYDGSYYEGNWKGGKRNGFGFSIAPRKPVRAGEWHEDRYKGERLVYSSDRIYGIDISKYQHVIGKKKYSIDWKKLRIVHLGTRSRKTISGNVNYPISFVYIKSTEGATLLNPYYRKDYVDARSHGFKVGSYHFFSTLSPAGLQARQFLRHTFVKKGDLPPVLDVEPNKEQIKKMGGISVLFAHVRTWLRIVERETGVRPILYVNQTFVNRYLDLAPDLKHDYNIWIARYGEYKPDVHLVYWQLCPDGRVSGIHGEVDINVFNGYQDAYKRFVASHSI